MAVATIAVQLTNAWTLAVTTTTAAISMQARGGPCYWLISASAPAAGAQGFLLSENTSFTTPFTFSGGVYVTNPSGIGEVIIATSA